VSNITFGGVSDDSITDNILLIQFINSNVKPFDAYSEIPQSNGFWAPYSNSWYWRESDTVTLKFDTGEPAPFWLTMTQSFYKIADLMCQIVIQGPYHFIKYVAGIIPSMASSVGSTVNTPNNKGSSIMSPIKKFFSDLWSIIKGIFMKIYGWIKWCFLKIVRTIGDIPSFLTYIFTGIISFITTVVTKTFDLISTIFNAFISIIEAILQIPLMIFDIINSIITLFVNLITMLIKLPISILNMVIGFQKIIMDIMTKSPKIPFLDMFFG
jgi:phage-related protein